MKRCVELNLHPPIYGVLPKSSGYLNSTRELVVEWPTAARLGEQYPLRINVPTAVKARGRVLESREVL